MPRCRFEPWGREVEVEMHSTVLEAARACGVPVEAACGGRRACGTCAVKVLSGALAEPNQSEAEIIKDKPIRLACRAQIVSDVVVRPLVGAASREPLEVAQSKASGKQRAEVVSPASADAGVFAAVDIGTTSIKVALIEIQPQEKTLKILAQAHNTHYQSAWGADVITRASQALNDPVAAKELMRTAQEGVVAALDEALSKCDKCPANQLLDCVQIAGNPLMSALLCGAPLESYLQPPYGDEHASLSITEGPLFDYVQSRAVDIEMRITPALARLVGGDITAALLGIELDDAQDEQTQDAQTQGAAYSISALFKRRPYLYIDMGTNVESALVSDGQVFVGSAPAGSAFAAEGETGSLAIEHINDLLMSGALSRDGLLDETHPSVIRNDAGLLEAAGGRGAHTQLEIRALQLIKAAFSVTIAEVVRASGLEMGEIDTVYLGGVFAENTDLEALFNTGFLPRALRQAHIQYVPQSVVRGAALLSTMNDSEFGEFVSSLTRQARPVDFVQDDTFNARLLAALSFE